MHLMTLKTNSREQDEQLPALKKLHRFPELHRFVVKLPLGFDCVSVLAGSHVQPAKVAGARGTEWDSVG